MYGGFDIKKKGSFKLTLFFQSPLKKSSQIHLTFFTLWVAAFFVAQAVAQGMVEAGIKGSIINISSQMGIVGGKKRTVYCASKHAMEGFSKSMALDLAENGIRVNTVCPTFVETELTKPFMAEREFKDYVISRIPLGHIGKTEDVADAVLFLASNMSKMVTGSAIKVDGGWTAI